MIPELRLSVPARTQRLPEPLTERQTQALLRCADTLIPEVGPNPAASRAEEYDYYLALALAAREDARDEIAGYLDRIVDRLELDDEMRRLSGEDPDLFQALSAVIAGAYFMTPQVKELIGYPGQHRDPARIEEAADELSSGILDPVLERGAFHVVPPET